MKGTKGSIFIVLGLVIQIIRWLYVMLDSILISIENFHGAWWWNNPLSPYIYVWFIMSVDLIFIIVNFVGTSKTIKGGSYRYGIWFIAFGSLLCLYSIFDVSYIGALIAILYIIGGVYQVQNNPKKS